MADENYVWALVRWAKRSAENYSRLQKRSCDLWDQIVTHGGGQLVSVAAPGQHIAYSRPMTVQDEFDAVELAISILEGQPGIVRTCYPVHW